MTEPSHPLRSTGAGRSRPPAPELRRFGSLALFAALYTYALIVFGGIVRITGSGLGCGDDWPLCNGHWIPPFDVQTLIEYTHRLLAAGIGLVILLVYAYAFRHRHRPGFRGHGGVIRPCIAGAVLLVVQIVLGAITVKLELPTAVIATHFVVALLFLATLLVSAVRTGILGTPRAGDPAVASRAARIATAGVLFALITIGFGALTANIQGAPQACQGFPLCNGMLVPSTAVVPVHIHWTHRLLAFGLFFYTLGATWLAKRERTPAPVARAAQLALGAVAVQLGVAAGLVLMHLPAAWQAIHLATGAAVWICMVSWAALARRASAAARSSVA